MASRRPFYFEWIYQNYSQFLRVLFICYSTFACTQQSGCDKRVRVLLFRTMLMDKTRHCDAFPTNTFHEYRQRWNNSIQSNNNSFIREQRIRAAVTCRWRLSTWRRTWSIGVRFFFHSTAQGPLLWFRLCFLSRTQTNQLLFARVTCVQICQRPRRWIVRLSKPFFGGFGAPHQSNSDRRIPSIPEDMSMCARQMSSKCDLPSKQSHDLWNHPKISFESTNNLNVSGSI